MSVLETTAADAELERISDELDALYVVYREANERIARLTVAALGRAAALHLPDAAFLELDESDQEGCYYTIGNYLSATGELVEIPEGLTDGFWSIVNNLGDDNWQHWQTEFCQARQYGGYLLDLDKARAMPLELTA
ncbi:hypothetical protein [Streptomyces sp. cg36]|uniref:hypothetical protein n=1 Tax=Streptomyces sp. cg36 TaxID=3238798 RepID=UPI0034E1B8B4